MQDKYTWGLTTIYHQSWAVTYARPLVISHVVIFAVRSRARARVCARLFVSMGPNAKNGLL